MAAFESVTIREEEPLTLDQILELGNTLTVDIGKQEALGQGQALSARIPIRVPGAPGGDLDGFFTKTVRVDTYEDEKRFYAEQRKKLGKAIKQAAADVNAPYPRDRKTMGDFAATFYAERART